MTKTGLSAARLERLHDILTGYVERGAAPGLVALVSRRGATHVATLGSMALDSDDPMQRDTIFRIASMTKPITAAATMSLVEECRLRLDDPVNELLPELADRRVLKRIDGPVDDTEPAQRPLTTRDLLAFTAGYGIVLAPPGTYPIQDAIDELGIIGFGPPDPTKSHASDEWMARLGTLPLFHQPGEQWLYNTGSYILGVLIERASGRSFEDFLRERIFEPLGMRDTGFSVPAGKLDRLSASYWTNGETGALDLFDAAAESYLRQPPAFPDGGGGLVSTVDDMLAFGLMLLGEGVYEGQRILSRPSVELMMSDQLTPEQRAASPGIEFILGNHSWGFGGQVITRREQVAFAPGTYGWSGGFGTTWYCDPAEAMMTILMTQASMTAATGPVIFQDFWTAAYAAIDD